MKLTVLLLVIVSLLYLPFLAESQQSHKSKHGAEVAAASGTEKAPAYIPMPGPGKKVPIIGTDYYLTYGFDKKPKLGTVILKVELFNKEGKKDTSMEIKADAGMPSMKGAHDMGDQPMKLEFDLRDSQGKSKTLHVEYKQ